MKFATNPEMIDAAVFKRIYQQIIQSYHIKKAELKRADFRAIYKKIFFQIQKAIFFPSNAILQPTQYLFSTVALTLIEKPKEQY